jgi:hypothetical protein
MMGSNDSSNRPTLFQSFERLKTHLESIVTREKLGGIPDQDVTTSVQDLLPGLDTFAQLGRCFQLSPFEQLILLLAIALELEPNFQALYAQVQGNQHQPYATLGLALATLPGADYSVLSPQNPLHYWQLIHLEPGRILTGSPITLDRRILCYLLGEPALDSNVAEWVSPISPIGSPDFLPLSQQEIVQQLIATWSGAAANQPLPLISLTGTDATAHRTIAAMACDRLGFQLMALSTAMLPTDPHELKQFQRHWEREAILSNSALLLDGEMALAAELSRQAAIALFLETLNTPVMFSTPDSKPRLRRPVIALEIPSLSQDEQIALWQTHLGNHAAALNGQLPILANQFKLTPTAIQTICHQFKLHSSPTFPPSSPPSLPSPSHPLHPSPPHPLWTLCRHQARPNLDDLAQRISTTTTWADLILPSRQHQVLEDIATHLKYRAQIYQTWGFAQKGDRGLGISALFHGDSGTGKTMAAEVLAQECCLDLYRIDLSTVVSKYIGETEKNLRRIFDAAEAGGVILLFDEADALFGKRTEVKDSHDRHANIEVSYLLQRMETYQGLAILTSNLKNNLDEAFLRRLRFMVPFPFPDAHARADIWRRIFPAQTPTQDLDYDKLGQLKIAGGNIRNIALNAAFLAAQAKQPVTMGHIRQAAQRDYLKLEKLLTTEELKGWDA